jgi:hypothetical protein
MYEDARFTSPVSGTSGFTEEFMKRGPRDSQGRSLRELDLRDRLFRYPCSFLVHSEAFDALHDELRGRVIRRMCEILIDPISPKQWENVDADARQVVLEILVSTKPEFADCVAELQREK